jgi:hypothetical protein
MVKLTGLLGAAADVAPTVVEKRENKRASVTRIVIAREVILIFIEDPSRSVWV